MRRVLREASSKERELQTSKAPLDVSSFLGPVGGWELRHIRKLSSLTALTYFMHLVTPRRLQRMHKLELVTTSRACEIRPYEHSRTAEEVGADGDGMAVSFAEARRLYAALKRDTPLADDEEAAAATAAAATAGPESGAVPVVAAAGMSNIVTLAREVPYNVVSPSTGGQQQAAAAAAALQSGGGPAWPVPPGLAAGAAGSAAAQETADGPAAAASGSSAVALSGTAAGAGLSRMLRSPAEVVAAKLAEAAMAASTAAAGSFYAGLASLPIGGVLVGANNRASNALLAPLSAAAQASLDAGAGGSSAAGGGPKATAASIAALATAELGKQSVRGAVRARGGDVSGLAAVSASGMLSPAAANGATAAGGALPAGGAAAAGAALCPSEWFVVDDPASATRVFVIQGSDTLDHWRLNLTFDPVVFEDPVLGVKVHRGVYEAALVLYDRFLPLVYEHLESSPFSKVTFTGHSIGGSLATLLLLMYRHRGVLPPHSIAPVYTFGAPAVFCQTAHAHSHSHGSAAASAPGRAGSPGSSAAVSSSSGSSLWSLSTGGSLSSVSSLCSMEDGAAAAAPHPATAAAAAGAESSVAPPHACGCACGADTLLARLGLPPAAVRNVIMARDVVPRAFACDYSPVADILRSWGSSFKEHSCLNRRGRKHLYYFVGRMYVLQPDVEWLTFVGTDPEHPMLPPGCELYVLTDRPHDHDQDQGHLSASSSSTTTHASAAIAAAPPSRGIARVAAAGPAAPPARRLQARGPVRAAASSVVEAVWELMDCPHPLETLADPGAYLAAGIISRYHNPEHYTKALGRLAHLRRQAGADAVDAGSEEEERAGVEVVEGACCGEQGACGCGEEGAEACLGSGEGAELALPLMVAESRMRR
ncbi:hypothetical protein GPECTOR_70g523 [Gonium pectorale]|uniref:Fungal lipase-type domain-containing protein n=1 Tax=Gonium pectorale TaxID=33097 RepID=A0A150G343_GONPE|nr:hypothetical protein GPECTOR_70g523 [Gonium pectorale]|eukprot:KXZ44292.1 hypothetical protein GPECTOR_70g523 [Gonium pectorale]